MLARIGEVEIWRVLESNGRFMPVRRFFPEVTDEQLDACRPWLTPGGMVQDRKTGEDWLVLPVQSFLLRTPRSLILVDACVGNHKTLPQLPMWNNARSGRFMAALAAAGAAPEDVTHVLCTHLHVDHIGWTTMQRDGRWVPTFPNARVLGTEADLAHARAAAEAAPDGIAANVWRDTLAPLLDAGRFDAVAPDHQPDEAVRLRPAPGHTPGHVMVEVLAQGGDSSGGLTVIGDLMHSPIQCGAPELAPIADADPDLAARTRRAVMAEAAAARRLLIGSHFPLPSVGRVEAEGAGFRWVPVL